MAAATRFSDPSFQQSADIKDRIAEVVRLSRRATRIWRVTTGETDLKGQKLEVVATGETGQKIEVVAAGRVGRRRSWRLARLT